MNKARFLRLSLLVVLGVTLIGVSAGTLKRQLYSRFEKSHYLTSKQTDYIRPGLNLEMLDLSVADRTVELTLRLTDDLGAALDPTGIDTPGTMSARLVVGYIPEGEEQYVSFTNRTVTSTITGVTAVQPTAVAGTLVPQAEEGIYTITLANILPENDDPNATHTVGMYVTRDLRPFGLTQLVVNEITHFTPAGGEVPFIRDIARTESCNKCHEELGLHGGARKEVALCIMCHTDGVIDPDTGNSVDMDVLIHKIHMGEHLPSVQAGTPYQIIGFNNSVHDYSKVVFPQDVRNCDSCHTPEAGTSMAHLLNPNRESCGACHDNVNFATGENHADLPQVSDNLCSNCHIPEGELEFDVSILGAHTLQENSTQLAGINLEILGLADTLPGDYPTVSFKMANDAGEGIDPNSLGSLRFLIAGPNTDFHFLASEAAQGHAMEDGDHWTYTFNTQIPEDATGSYTISAEANRNVLLNAGTTTEVSYRETMGDHPTTAFAVTDASPIARRKVVADESCDSCHKDLTLHGGNRHDPNYCVMCHQPSADDSIVRVEGPARSIDFKLLVHRIHKGEELERDYTVIGFRGTPHNYNEVLYPGKLNNCETCHVNSSYDVPSKGIETTTDLNEFYSPMPPNSAACLGCHDTLGAAAHTWINTAPFGESCDVCHGNGADFDVAKVHAL